MHTNEQSGNNMDDWTWATFAIERMLVRIARNIADECEGVAQRMRRFAS
jgi:hypothetical protein